MWECQTQENNNSGKYKQNVVTYAEFMYDRNPVPASKNIIHYLGQYLHGLSLLQIFFLVLLAACAVYAKPLFFFPAMM